jgi:hypothetical protein
MKESEIEEGGEIRKEREELEIEEGRDRTKRVGLVIEERKGERLGRKE